MLWGFILRDSYIFDDGLGFFNDAVEENLVLLLIVPWAPVMEVAIDAVFNLDMHDLKIINLLAHFCLNPNQEALHRTTPHQPSKPQSQPLTINSNTSGPL